MEAGLARCSIEYFLSRSETHAKLTPRRLFRRSGIRHSVPVLVRVVYPGVDHCPEEMLSCLRADPEQVIPSDQATTLSANDEDHDTVPRQRGENPPGSLS